MAPGRGGTARRRTLLGALFVTICASVGLGVSATAGASAVPAAAVRPASAAPTSAPSTVPASSTTSSTTTAPAPTTTTPSPAPAPIEAAAATIPPAPATTTPALQDGCAAALAYLAANSAPGFQFECPGNALGHQAMTCIDVAGVCPGAKIIAIADACPAAYMNEAHNSWVLSGLQQGSIDPYGYCH